MPTVRTSSRSRRDPSPADNAAGPQLDIRAFSEILADLVGSERDDVIVVAVVTRGRSRVPAGRNLGRPEIVDIVDRGAARPAAPPEPQHHIATGWDSLTERERSVALLAGQALTNQQIAYRLLISPHTVNYHLRQIFRKLAIDSRVSLARFVQDQPPVLGSTAPGPRRN